MRFFAPFAVAFLSLSTFACGGSGDANLADGDEGALERETTTGDVVLTVSAQDSKAAKDFLVQFVRGLRDIVDLDRRDEGLRRNDQPWLSTDDDLETDIYKTKRNDGAIECKGTEKCTFSLKRVTIDGGNAVSKGDRNYWGGTLFNKFAGYAGNALGGNQSQNDTALIGKKGTIPFIECARAGQQEMGFGLSAEACTFHLKR